MTIRLPAIFAVAVLALASCVAKKTTLPSPALGLQPRLAAADALLRVGCFDCLADALREYDAIRQIPGAPPSLVDAAADGAIRAATLLDLRERELGMADDGYLQRARDLAGARDDRRVSFSTWFEIVETIPWKVARYSVTPTGSPEPKNAAALQASRETWTDELRMHADGDELSAYLWVAFDCTQGDPGKRQPELLLAPLTRLRDAPLVRYRIATCDRIVAQALSATLQDEPRYIEAEYGLALAAIGRLNLDEAERRLKRAYLWHRRWPAAAAALGSVYIAADELEPALESYDQALALAPHHGEALIGRVRALSQLGRHEEAFATIALILAGSRWFPGEAYYWRAWNHAQVGRIDQAWEDVEQAGRLWVNSAVLKLAGVIAMRRHELGVARQRLEAAAHLDPSDCEITFQLGNLHAEQREWTPSADRHISTAACLAGAQRKLAEEIVKIQASSATPERKARQIAKREQQQRTAARMLATSWFNTAVAYFNLTRKSEARQYAEKVSDDEQFGERARALLTRLEK